MLSKLWKMAVGMLIASLLVFAAGCPKCPDCTTFRITSSCVLPSMPTLPPLESARETDGGLLALSPTDARKLQAYLYRIRGWGVQAAACAEQLSDARPPVDSGTAPQ